MKKVLLALLSLFLITFSINAQVDAGTAFKKAGKALASYNLDPSNNKDKIDEAKEMIQIAISSADLNSDANTWQRAGEIYNAIASNELSQKQVAELKGEGYMIQNLDAPVKAIEAFQNALKFSQKKFQTKDALKSVRETLGYLNVFANSQLGDEPNYASAYPLLEGMNSIRKMLLDNGENDIFESQEAINNNLFLTAYAASNADNKERASEIFDQLIQSKEPKVEYFTLYYNLLQDAGKTDRAGEVLAMAQKSYPNNKEVLFAEINKYLKEEKFDILEGKLKKAIEADPTNASVYNVMGDVYQNLNANQMEAGNLEKAEQYFNQALESYQKALELDPSLTYPVYSIGSIYYNKAAAFVPKMNALGTSKKDQVEYDRLQGEMTALFDKALPFFLKAEKNEPNDRNTIIALKEIYARKNDFEKSKIYKDKLDVIEGN